MKNTDNRINSAVERLNHILPLAARHQALDASLQNLHKAILHSYVDTGRSLNRKKIAQYVDNVDEAAKIFGQNDLVVFDDNGEPIGAYPFTMEKRDHTVTVNGHTVHCMCALDALAVSPMFNLPTRVTSRCFVTNEPIIIQQQKLKTLNQTDAGDTYFGINWNAASDNSYCADSLCKEMIFLKNKTVADKWLSENPEQRQTFQLGDAIDFAARFFTPLLGNQA